MAADLQASADDKVLELFETEEYTVAKRQWGLPKTISKWTDNEGNPQTSLEEYEAPDSWIWTSNWKYEQENHDRRGWEYGTAFDRFFAADRPIRSENRWSDRFRRRHWTRTMRHVSKIRSRTQELETEVANKLPVVHKCKDRLMQTIVFIEQELASNNPISRDVYASIPGLMFKLNDMLVTGKSLMTSVNPPTPNTRKLLRDIQRELDELNAIKLNHSSLLATQEDQHQHQDERKETEYDLENHQRQILSKAREEKEAMLIFQSAKVQGEEDVTLMIMEERKHAMENVQSAMSDLNEMFTDLGVLVGRQQEAVDAIERNVEDTQQRTQEGIQQIVEANRHQKGCFIS